MEPFLPVAVNCLVDDTAIMLDIWGYLFSKSGTCNNTIVSYAVILARCLLMLHSGKLHKNKNKKVRARYRLGLLIHCKLCVQEGPKLQVTRLTCDREAFVSVSYSSAVVACSVGSKVAVAYDSSSAGDAECTSI